MNLLLKRLSLVFSVILLLAVLLQPMPSAAEEGSSSSNDTFRKAYITSYSTGVVDVIDLDTLTVEMGKIIVGNQPNSAGFNPNRTQIFVTNRADGTVSIIDPSTDTVIKPFKLAINHTVSPLRKMVVKHMWLILLAIQ